MFAVIKTGGLQYRVAANDVITVGKLAGEPGDIVELGDVLMLGGDAIVVGTPAVAGATVAGEIVRQERGPKIIAFKKRRRKNSRRKRGHRQDFTVVRITEILTDGRKPERTARPLAEPKPAENAEAGSAEGAAEANLAAAKEPGSAAGEPGAPKHEAAAPPKAEPAEIGKKS
jgi:large subunit ribosomal protein L21